MICMMKSPKPDWSLVTVGIPRTTHSSGVYPHGRNAIQFGYQVRLGQSPLEAVRSATIVAAELLGWDDRVGSVRPGRFADLVAFGADPLVDIEALRTPSTVVKGGITVG